MPLIAPKSWREFQHYKDRSPPWIRLHRKLLDDRDFHRLPVASRALAPMLWLLASESVDGVIDADHGNLAFRLRTTEKEIASAMLPLMERGFFVTLPDASNALADCRQPAVPEAEAEAEAFTDSETEADPEAETGFGQPASAGKPAKRSKSAQTWDAYSSAYTARYGVAPVRNAHVNAQLAQLVGKLGAEEAPLVAAHFLSSQNRFYVTAGHAVGVLLRDAEKLRTEWATGRQTTATQAMQADKTQTNFNAFAPLIAQAKAKELFDAERQPS